MKNNINIICYKLKEALRQINTIYERGFPTFVIIPNPYICKHSQQSFFHQKDRALNVLLILDFFVED